MMKGYPDVEVSLSSYFFLLFNLLILYKTMAKNKVDVFERVAATKEQIEAAKKASMHDDYLINPGRHFTIKSADYTGHTRNGVKAQRAKAIAYLKEAQNPLYVQSMVKTRYDIDEKVVELTGTFTQWVDTFDLVGVCVDCINDYLIDVEIVARVQSFTGYDKNGDVRPIRFNTWDFADDKVAEKAAAGKFSKPKKTTTTAKNK